MVSFHHIDVVVVRNRCGGFSAGTMDALSLGLSFDAGLLDHTLRWMIESAAHVEILGWEGRTVWIYLWIIPKSWKIYGLPVVRNGPVRRYAGKTVR